MNLSELGEFGLIGIIREMLSPEGEGVLMGVGDDAAVIDCGAPHYLAFTADMLVEGVHFDLSFVDGFSLGYKALTVNLSDLAAVGGEAPSFALISLGLPPDTDVGLVEEIYRGLREAARRYGCSLVGGDTVSSPERLVLSVALLGGVKRENLVLRKGARVGDAIMVSGYLGESAIGLALLKSGIGDEENYPRCVTRHLRPEPRIDIGNLTRSWGASAVIDISDGLLKDLSHICEENGVGARVELSRIPISPEIKTACEELSIDPLPLILGGGEDYELLFTVKTKRAGAIERAGKSYIIGEVVHASEGIRVIGVDGKEVKMPTAGYDHFLGRKT